MTTRVPSLRRSSCSSRLCSRQLCSAFAATPASARTPATVQNLQSIGTLKAGSTLVQ